MMKKDVKKQKAMKSKMLCLRF